MAARPARSRRTPGRNAPPRRAVGRIALLGVLLALSQGGCGEGSDRMHDGRTRAQWAAQLDAPGASVAERRSAVDALGMLANAAPDAPAIAASLARVRASDPDEETRRRAAVALGAAGQAGVQGLAQSLSDASPRVVEAALVALGTLGPMALPAAPALAPLLASEQPTVAHQAALAYARLPEAALENLAPFAHHADPHVRGRVAALLAAAGWTSQTARDLLVAAAADADWNVRKTALAGLAPRAPRDVEARDALARALDDPHPFVAAAAVRALGELGSAAAPHVERLAGLLASEQGPLRAAAAATLGRIGPPARPALPALEAAAAKEQGAAAAQLWLARWRITGEADASVGHLADLVASGSGTPTALEAVEALRALGPAAAPATRALARALEDRGLRLAAAAALEAVGPGAREAEAALQALENEPNVAVREAAQRALKAVRAGGGAR